VHPPSPSGRRRTVVRLHNGSADKLACWPFLLCDIIRKRKTFVRVTTSGTSTYPPWWKTGEQGTAVHLGIRRGSPTTPTFLPWQFPLRLRWVDSLSHEIRPYCCPYLWFIRLPSVTSLWAVYCRQAESSLLSRPRESVLKILQHQTREYANPTTFRFSCRRMIAPEFPPALHTRAFDLINETDRPDARVGQNEV